MSTRINTGRAWISAALYLCALGLAQQATAAPTEPNTATVIQKTKGYKAASKHFLTEVRAYMRSRYKRQKMRLERAYNAKFSAKEKREAALRQKTIHTCLAFLKRFPNHPHHSPSVMYRLAELYYEQEFQQYLIRMTRFDAQQQQNTTQQTPPRKQFTRTRRWLQRLVKRFPRYRYTPHAYSLLGYCFKEEGNATKAMAKWQKLLKIQRPKVPVWLASETWMRLGEIYFNKRQFALANAAYTKALRDTTSKLYDKMLYKLGWIHYLQNAFPSAVARWTQLLRLYHKRQSNRSKGTLYTETIRYLAACFADETWGSQARIQQYFGTFKRPYTREVLREISKNYRVQRRWDALIAMHQWMLSKHPTHPNNPTLIRDALHAVHAQRNSQKSIALERQMRAMLQPGSAWYKANQHNVKAMRTARRLLIKSLYRSAVFLHVLCQRARAAKTKTTTCRRAANAYQTLLRTSPHHKDAYKITWYLADSLSLDKQHRLAANYYRQVRDWPNRSTHRYQAGLGYIYMLSKQVDIACQQKRIVRACEHTKAPVSKKNTTPQATQKLPIPALQQALIRARIQYLALPVKGTLPDGDEQRYLLARIYYAYQHNAQALMHCWHVIRRHPKSSYRNFAAKTIIAIHWRQGDINRVQLALTSLKRAGINTFSPKVTEYVLQRKAQQLHKAGKHLQAAMLYVKLIKRSPNHKRAPEILWNAAHYLSLAGRFQRAIQQLNQILQRYPQWKLRPQVHSQIARLAGEILRPTLALHHYQQLAAIFQRNNAPQRGDAIYNVAILQKALQRYAAAAKSFAEVSRRQPNHTLAAQSLLEAASLFQQAGQPRLQLRTLKRLIKRYGKPKWAAITMRAYGAWMKALTAQSASQRQRKQLYKRIVKAHHQLGPALSPQQKKQLNGIPAKAAYQLIMFSYDKFKKMRLNRKSIKKYSKGIRKKSVMFARLAKQFAGLAKYGSVPWMLCGLYHTAKGRLHIADLLSNAPIPRELSKGTDTYDTYRSGIGPYVMRIEDAALKELQRVIKTSQRLHFSNRCTRAARLAAHRMAPHKNTLSRRTKPSAPLNANSPLPMVKRIK